MTENKVQLHKNPLKNRSAVQRTHSRTYILITLLSFAFSVTATRVFLNLTGFPQIGGGNLHIAHVLWGGLFLFAASLIPLIYVNQWALEMSSFAAGIGVGLFIDEVGKFITANNDYFFPSAAPIIYAFFLLTVLVFIQVKRQRKPSARSQMYSILEKFAEVLDRDLSQREYDDISAQLDEIIGSSAEPQLISLAQSLRAYLLEHKNQIVPDDPGLLERCLSAFERFRTRWLTRDRVRLILIIGLLLWAAWGLTSQTIMFISTHNPQAYKVMVEDFIENRLIVNETGMSWFAAQILLEGSMGAGALAAVIFFLFKKDAIATWIGLMDMIIMLAVVNLITFYFDQFSTIAFAVYEFIMLVFLLFYKRNYLSTINPQLNNYSKD
jgi:hypothetical protein